MATSRQLASQASRRAVLLALIAFPIVVPTLGHAQGSCPDYVPASCTVLAPGDQLPTKVTQCYRIDQAGTGPYIENNVNVLDGGAIYFVEDPGKTIDFQVSSLLVEKGGVVQAGSPNCPFGKSGGKLTIGLWGDDPTNQGKIQPAGAGIKCMTRDTSDDTLRCFPEGITPKVNYCTVSNSDNPCSSTTPPASEPNNKLLEGYGDLNFDTNPFGYKVLAVAYGGELNFFGYKGVKPLQDPSWGSSNDSNQNCVVPTVQQSTLDSAEMQAWANLSGSSWARLAGTQDDAANGHTILTIDRALPDWEVGDNIVIGATDWYPNHSELRTIVACSQNGVSGNTTKLCVDTLKYPHNASIFDTKTLVSQNQASFTDPVNRSAVDLRATVGLLSRSIQVYSLGTMPKRTAESPGFPETKDCLAATPNADCYFGGHMMARQGFKAVRIQGVEFKQLGQGGRMGHYPVHFHMAKSAAYAQNAAFVKDSAVWDSMTRFITVHGTHEVTVARNVGYLSLGHGYYIEDGSEIRNLLCHNLGVGARGALQEYYTAQAKPEHWCNGAPPPAARVIPPILDGVANSDGGPRSMNLGSDSYMPVMFWAMNNYNEFVGNAAVGVHGFGSCFWFLGSTVSGPSRDFDFEGFANYNSAGFQAPLLRFRGNSCMSSALALSAQGSLDPATQNASSYVGFNAVANPYMASPVVGTNYKRPIVNGTGNYLPIQPDGPSRNCTTTNPDPKQLEYNTQSCVTTVVDRFSTSFNWAQVNYSSVWLRPWYYLFANGAVTDQLFAGLTFVTGGDWFQAPPAYIGLAKNSLFVGTSQFGVGASPYADRSGPIFPVDASSNLANYAPCSRASDTCNIDEAGTGYWKGEFNPKRLISIYDGPHFADGNTFLNVGAWECDPQPCRNKQPGQCTLTALPCGIYSSTRQPQSPTNPNNIVIPDAGVGWKQTNGFFYPPAFTYRRNSYLKDLPKGLPAPPNGQDPLNQCVSAGPPDYVSLVKRPGDCRHNVIDRTQTYLQGNIQGLNAAGPQVFSAAQNQLPASPIDFSTILVDLDATLTGAHGILEGATGQQPTTSVSKNRFFDAPSQSPECQAYGVQTSPLAFVTTAVGQLQQAPTATNNTVSQGNWPGTPLVALYRQWKLSEDAADTCEQVCDGTNTRLYGCPRATFMGMANVGQSTYLTMTEPPGLPAAQPGAGYYIDTNSGNQATGCITTKTGDMQAAPFVGGKNYIVYNMFPRAESRTRYQLYVGNATSLDDIQGRFVRVQTRIGGGNSSAVTEPCDPRVNGTWCYGMKAELSNSILTVTLDHAPLATAGQFEIANQDDYARCMPRDLCYYDSASKGCKRCTPGTPGCIRQNDFLPIDVATMNKPDANGEAPLDIVCEDWSGMISGNTKIDQATVSFADCPAGGCLGFAFQLPQGFAPMAYKDVGKPLSYCFLESAWMSDSLQERTANGPADPLCGAPRPQAGSDFCADSQLSLVTNADAHISEASPAENQGDDTQLVVDGGGEGNQAPEGLAVAASVGGKAIRTVVGFDANAIESFVAQGNFQSATLELTVAEHEHLGGESDLIDAYPLQGSFVEGEGEVEDHESFGGPTGAAASSPLAGVQGVASPLAGTSRLAGRKPRLARRVGGRELAPGVTWNCAADANTSNDHPGDCHDHWDVDGGDHGAATADPILVEGVGDVVAWDVTQDVLNGTSSWLIRKRDETDPTGIAFHSREGAGVLGATHLAPRLILK